MGTQPHDRARLRGRSGPADVKNKSEFSLHFMSTRRQEPSPGELIHAGDWHKGNGNAGSRFEEKNHPIGLRAGLAV